MSMYETRAWQSYRDGGDGPELMANFTAWITDEVRYDDGMNTTSILTIAGEMPPSEEQEEPRELPPIEISAEEFAGMAWPMKRWGVRAIIYPIPGVKDDLRTMIQGASDPELKTVYRHTGWIVLDGKPAYLHRGGAITAKGNRTDVTVSLPPELERYDLTCKATPVESIRASLDLLGLARPDLSWPLLAATLAPLYGPVDFGVHLTGRTGSFKSELLSLYQSHYGAGMDARHLPGSWSSTANANEALSFLAANAVLVIDDFVPRGSTHQQRALHASADKLFRAQGNQSGRARLTDSSNLQKTMYPRGVIFSTGEETPEGHSCRGRIMIRELSPGEIDPDKLTKAQSKRTLYPGTVAWLAQSLAQEPADLTPRIEAIRARERGVGHGRTPTTMGRLIAVAEDFLKRARVAGCITASEEKRHAAEATKAILDAGAEQQSFLEDSDPVDEFCGALRRTLAAGRGHLKQTNGGTPAKATLLGWTTDKARFEMPVFRAGGPCIGWIQHRTDSLFLDVTSGVPVVRKECGADMTLSTQTLFKRLKEAGYLRRAEDNRSRNTVRVVCENSPRTVLCLTLSKVMQWENASDGTDPEPNDDGTDGGYDPDPSDLGESSPY